ncbi:MAG: Eco57I restriction-modification methylase domain-containing protein [Myxococcales bacterium]|nr:Eco57I restriction-modification methylase domain-containing protein [Myxococcales bacterium]
MSRPIDTQGRARTAALSAAVEDLAGQGETERGAVFTRAEVVDAILTLARYTPARPLHRARLLEPSLGAGEFFLQALDRLLDAYARHGGAPSRALELRPSLFGVELHRASLSLTRDRARARLVEWGATRRTAAALCDAWLHSDDFLLAALPGPFDVIVGNPPYVRLERIPAPLMAEYRRRYATLYDRADLYVAFFERGLDALAADGRLAFICANRWMKNRYGRPLRAKIAAGFHVEHAIDMEGTDAFVSEVMAYTAITVIRRGRGDTTRVARKPEVSRSSLARLCAGMLADADDPRVTSLRELAVGDAPWILEPRGPVALLRRLERELPTLEQAGLKVGIGVASGADRVFVGDHAALPVEPARKLPLVMSSDLVDGALCWRGRGVVNPFEEDGSLVRLDRYPRLRAYLEAHRAALSSRYVARRGGARWYRTIDRIDARLTRTPKLLIPDIKGEAMVVYDEGRFYPHHNLYHVVVDEAAAPAERWDLQALATVLRSSIAVLFIAAYCVKMSGGYLRFQAQYLRRIRVPRWSTVSPSQRRALRAAPATDLEAIDRLVFAVCGLSPAEAAAVTAAAAAARVGRGAAASAVGVRCEADG